MANPDFIAPITAIAALSISGVTTNYTLATAPDALYSRDCPALIANGIAGASGEPRSMGTAGTALYDYVFSLDYDFIYIQAGQSRTVGELITAAETLLGTVIGAIQAVDTTATGTIRIKLSSRGKMGLATYRDGKTEFVGCPVSFSVWQLAQ